MLILALGSNLGNRLQNIEKAMCGLSFVSEFKHTSIIETQALLLPDSPPEWDRPYLNTIVSGECDLPPLEILKRIKTIESSLGRDLNAPLWSPRTIDIDILMLNNKAYQSDTLTIPHKELNKRDFWVRLMGELLPL